VITIRETKPSDGPPLPCVVCKGAGKWVRRWVTRTWPDRRRQRLLTWATICSVKPTHWIWYAGTDAEPGL